MRTIVGSLFSSWEGFWVKWPWAFLRGEHYKSRSNYINTKVKVPQCFLSHSLQHLVHWTTLWSIITTSCYIKGEAFRGKFRIWIRNGPFVCSWGAMLTNNKEVVVVVVFPPENDVILKLTVDLLGPRCHFIFFRRAKHAVFWIKI